MVKQRSCENERIQKICRCLDHYLNMGFFATLCSMLCAERSDWTDHSNKFSQESERFYEDMCS